MKVKSKKLISFVVNGSYQGSTLVERDWRDIPSKEQTDEVVDAIQSVGGISKFVLEQEQDAVITFLTALSLPAIADESLINLFEIIVMVDEIEDGLNFNVGKSTEDFNFNLFMKNHTIKSSISNN